LEHYGKDGEVKWVDYKLMANRLPTFHRFAEKINVDMSSLTAWRKIHPEFSSAYKRAKRLQKYFLIENGLNGCYNPHFTMFVAKNITDMRDVTDHKVLGDPSKPILQITVTPQELEKYLKQRADERKTVLPSKTNSS